MEYTILNITTHNMTDSQSSVVARQLLDDQMIRYAGDIYHKCTKIEEKSYLYSYTMDTAETELSRFGEFTTVLEDFFMRVSDARIWWSPLVNDKPNIGSLGKKGVF